MKRARYAAVTVAVIVMAVVILQNWDRVPAKILLTRLEMPLAAWLGGALAAGYLLGATRIDRYLFRRKKKEPKVQAD
jgi:uncharacterized integral membrane protein